MLYPVVVQRTDRLTLQVEAASQEDAYAQVAAFVAPLRPSDQFAHLLFGDWADEDTRPGVGIETDPILILTGSCDLCKMFAGGYCANHEPKEV